MAAADVDTESSQLIEGIGNEVLYTFILATGVALVFMVHVVRRPAQNVHAEVAERRSPAENSSEDLNGRSGISVSGGDANEQGNGSAADSAASDGQATRGDGVSGTVAPVQEVRGMADDPDQSEDAIGLEVRVAYSNTSRERQLRCVVSRTATLQDLKTTLFSDELEERRTLRFLYQGQLLNDDALLIGSGRNAGSVLTAIIGPINSQGRVLGDGQRREEDFDIGAYFPQALMAICIVGWTGAVMFWQAVAAPLVLGLIIITVLTAGVWAA